MPAARAKKRPPVCPARDYSILATCRDPWRKAFEFPVEREAPAYPLADLENGVKFFVLTLEERFGVTTNYSCEGHPNGFYVAFTATYEEACRIKSAGFFSVEIEKGALDWSMRLGPQLDEADKAKTLTWAAQAWQRAFWRDEA